MLKFPKLKHNCRIVPYIVVIGGCVASIALVINLDFLPATLAGMLAFSIMIATIVYIFKNFFLLMGLDAYLAWVSLYKKSRTCFSLRKGFSAEKAEKRIKRFGRSVSPTAIKPVPDALQYKAKMSFHVLYSAVEKVIALYHTTYLDKERYRAILSSATANFGVLEGKRRVLREKAQKNSPINRVLVVFIFAREVEESLRANAYKIVSSNDGDGYDRSIIPCIVDMSAESCVFNCLGRPFTGFGYPAKNRGIRLVKRYIFGGRLPLKGNSNMIDLSRVGGADFDLDLEQSLWSLWRTAKQKIVVEEREIKKQFEKMANGEVIPEDETLYVKLHGKGVILLVLERNEETKTVTLEWSDSWCYPKANLMSKADRGQIQMILSKHFAKNNAKVVFKDKNQ